MKRIAVISLIILFLSVQCGFAAQPQQGVSKAEENTQETFSQEMTQEELGEMFFQFLTTVDWDEVMKKAAEEQKNIDTLTVQPWCNRFLLYAVLGFPTTSLIYLAFAYFACVVF